jgi:hypothetical protein
MEWDEYGALRPIAFGLARWSTHELLDTDLPDTVVLREEHDFRPWEEYAVDRYGHPQTSPLYSPWQTLPLHDVLGGLETEIAVPVLLDSAKRENWLKQLGPLLEGQWGAWQSLDACWQPAIKLLVDLQNRFWPSVQGWIVMPWDHERGQRYDPQPQEIARFDPLQILGDHGLSEEQLAATYDWLCERGARLEGRGARSLGGDRLARLRLLADRRVRQRLRGPSRGAMDFYEAAEMIGRCWYSMTGRYLPSVDAAPHRRTTLPIDNDTVVESTHDRSPAALREQLRIHGLWPGRVHAVVEGRTEQIWIERLVRSMLGVIPDDLLITDLHGTGGASRMRRLVQTVADYATSSALMLDAEGDMAKYAHELINAGLVDRADVLLVGTSFEEANFTDEELVEVAAYIASHPPGDRMSCDLRLTGEQLRNSHDEVTRGVREGEERGLAGTLLELVRDPVHGPVNFTKIELNEALLDRVLNEIDAGRVPEISRRRPVVRFVADRIAAPLVNEAWR